MRIDKFLKDSRIIKRRTIAKQACDSGRVVKNDRTAKAGDEVQPGDVITVRFGDRDIRFKVLELIDSPRKEQAEQMYEIVPDDQGNAAAKDSK